MNLFGRLPAGWEKAHVWWGWEILKGRLSEILILDCGGVLPGHGLGILRS